MSSLMSDNMDPNSPLYYAPRRLRQPGDQTPEAPQGRGQASRQPQAAEVTQLWRNGTPEEVARNPSKIFEDAVSKALQESLEPEQVHSSSILDRRESRGLFGSTGKLIAAASVDALIALFFVVVLPMIRTTAAPGKAEAGVSVWQQLRASLFPAPQRKLSSTLVVSDQSGPFNEPLELGINVTAPTSGGSVIVSGLLTGSRLTTGKRVGANEWRIPALEVAGTSVIPPNDFVGQMNLSAELRGADGAGMVASNFRLVWTGANAFAPPPVPVAAPTPRPLNIAQPVVPPPAPQVVVPMASFAPPPPVAAPVTVPAPAQLAAMPVTSAAPGVRNLDPNEIASLIRRAQELATSGDFLPARLLLQRAADARSARAASILAETYDPIALKRFANGPLPDVNIARSWYRKAKEWGAPDAQRQLDALEAY